MDERLVLGPPSRCLAGDDSGEILRASYSNVRRGVKGFLDLSETLTEMATLRGDGPKDG